MADRDNKTIIKSFLCADIVEYSKDTIAGQIGLKDYFNTVLASAISDVPVQDRIILDTGDGAVISFLGNAEGALRTALNIRSRLLDAGANAPLQIRMGINLGPVRLVKDINGHPNIVGDGINVAQRLMAFANEGQILISRSYFEAVTRLSPEYADLFRHVGLLTDKHVRTHDVYAVAGGQQGISAALEKSAGSSATEIAFDTPDLRRVRGWVQSLWNRYTMASRAERMLYTGVLAGGLILLIVVAIYLSQRSDVQPVVEDVKSATQTVPVARALPPAVAPAVPQAAALSPVPATPVLARQKLPAPHTVQPAPAIYTAPAAPEVVILKQTPSVAVNPPVEVAIEPASINFAVTPWGEVYMDGKMMGISPPMTELHVAPGTHEFKIRNSTFPVYTQQIQVKAGDKIKIKHKFSN